MVASSDAEIVAGAWDFERINRSHARHPKVLAERSNNPKGIVASSPRLPSLRGYLGLGTKTNSTATRLRQIPRRRDSIPNVFLVPFDFVLA